MELAGSRTERLLLNLQLIYKSNQFVINQIFLMHHFTNILFFGMEVELAGSRTERLLLNYN